jgi:hypothetical protein
VTLSLSTKCDIISDTLQLGKRQLENGYGCTSSRVARRQSLLTTVSPSKDVSWTTTEGFNPAFEKYSPSTQLIAETIKDSIEEGPIEYAFCVEPNHTNFIGPEMLEITIVSRP